MPRIRDMFPSPWLKASDLEDGDLTLTIDQTVQEEVGQEKERKLVLSFSEDINGKEKKLILNKSNISSIVKLYGDDTDDWEGQKITLYVTEATYKGETTDAIRIRSKVSKEKKPAKAQLTSQKIEETEHNSDDPPF